MNLNIYNSLISTHQSAIQGLVLTVFMESSLFSVSESVNRSVRSDSLQPHEL